MAVGHHHALGPPRGPAGVDDVRQVLRRGPAARRLRRLRRQRRGRLVQVDDGRHAARRRREGAAAAADEHADAAVVQHHAQALGRVARVQRHVGAARLEHRQEGDDQLRAALQQHAHPRLRPHAPPRAGGARAGSPARPARAYVSVHLVPRPAPPRPASAAPAPRRARGCRRSARVRPLRAGSTPPPPAGAPPARAAPAADRRTSASAAPPAPAPAPGAAAIRSMVARSNRSVLYFSAPRRPRAVAASVSDRSNLASPSSAPTPLGAQPRQALVRALRVLQREHHLEERRVAQAALRLQLRHQLLEGHVLVLVRAQRRLAHAPQHLAEARVARQVGAQHQRVDEEADQLLHLPPRPPRDGAAHDDVLAPAVLATAAPGRRPAAP